MLLLIGWCFADLGSVFHRVYTTCRYIYISSNHRHDAFTRETGSATDSYFEVSRTNIYSIYIYVYIMLSVFSRRGHICSKIATKGFNFRANAETAPYQTQR